MFKILEKYRVEKKMTQDQLAEATGLSRSFLSFDNTCVLNDCSSGSKNKP